MPGNSHISKIMFRQFYDKSEAIFEVDTRNRAFYGNAEFLTSTLNLEWYQNSIF